MSLSKSNSSVSSSRFDNGEFKSKSKSSSFKLFSRIASKSSALLFSSFGAFVATAAAASSDLFSSRSFLLS